MKTLIRKAKMRVKFQMLASEEWIELVDRWRGAQPDVPNRSEAIRRLVLLALKVKEPK